MVLMTREGTGKWLEEDSAADLDDPVAEASTLDRRVDLSEGWRVQCCDRCREIGQVEDVGRLTPQLEGPSLIDVEVPEERSIDAATPRRIDGVLANGSVR